MGSIVSPSQKMTTTSATATSSSKARSPSPNYFGFNAPTSTLPISTQNGEYHTRQNWSPPSSTVRSTVGYSPTTVPIDQNPDFAMFRRQSEGMGRTFSLVSLQDPSQQRKTSLRGPTDNSNGRSYMAETRQKLPSEVKRSPPRPNVHILESDSLNVGRSPKRQLSSDSTNYPTQPRKASPSTIRKDDPDEIIPLKETMSAPIFALNTPSNLRSATSISQSVKTLSVEGSDDCWVTCQQVMDLLESNPEDILVLDLRVSTQYAKSRVKGSLNLCIPTTLIKRPMFNTGRLAETFKTTAQREKFERWKSTKYIIAYDASADKLQDATIGLNTIRKFVSEGYGGITCIIKGGFAAFAAKFPGYVDHGLGSSASGCVSDGTAAEAAELLPVVGGCPLPVTESAANPFFGNIRQNMDLIGGVGQMPLQKPARMTSDMHALLPTWLEQAADSRNEGAEVSNKFLHIEKKEQSLMQDALSSKVAFGTPSLSDSVIKIAGIEKGTKNRYNNIWPFEHTRVKLEDVPNNGCDYVNANHVQSSLSNKRYIATQGPIPATFTDFWNMIWQQDVRVIVMLTAEQEGGQIKAHDYWSDSQYGPFKLEQLSKRKSTLTPSKIYRHRVRPSLGTDRLSSDGQVDRSKHDSAQNTSPSNTVMNITPIPSDPFVTVRKFTLSHEQFPFQPIREITHLQYDSWPDFGVPANPSDLLGLVEQCDAVSRSMTGAKYSSPEPQSYHPVVVHCSAGCGRTGTFCTVDTVIDTMKRQRLNETSLSTNTSRPLLPERPLSSSTNTSTKSVTEKQDMSSESLDMRVSSCDENLDLVEKVVQQFRGQRISMVQSLRQYVLCYESIIEWIVEEERRRTMN